MAVTISRHLGRRRDLTSCRRPVGVRLAGGDSDDGGPESRPEPASNVHADLPLPSARCPDPDTSASRRVLVVDDDDDFRHAVASALEPEGWTVLEAGDGSAALAAAQTEQVSVIFLDCRLPDRSGQEVYRALRASGSSTPVVLVTTRVEVREAAAGLGVPHYLGKPFRLEDLLTVMDRAARSGPEHPRK